MNLSEEQVLALAPDEASKKSGKDLANPAKWVSKGVNEKALWGECQGSGSKPYQTQVDLSDIAFKCSCPSRKFPCKHGLGLMLQYARNKESFTNNTLPDWVSSWISKRAEKEEKKIENLDKPVDEAAQAKRQQARQLKVNEGIAELLLWIKDIVRNGLYNLPEKDAHYWENMARRMVDAQASGLASMVRALGQTPFYTEGWQSGFLDQLLRLFLVMQGYRNSDALPEALQQDIRAAIGFTQNQEALKSQTGITDTWLVLGKQVETLDNLTIERYWLYGNTSHQPALVLQFYVKNQVNQIMAITPGMTLQAELVFYPSACPLRAIIKTQQSVALQLSVKGMTGWQQVAASLTAQYEKLPIQTMQLFIVENLKPVWYQQQWWLQDNDQQLMQINPGFKNIWKLLALSGGAPLHMAVVGHETLYEPLGTWLNHEYKLL